MWWQGSSLRSRSRSPQLSLSNSRALQAQQGKCLTTAAHAYFSVFNNVICKKALGSQILIHKSLFFFFPVVAETGREVSAEQARADRLWIPSAGGLGVCSPPSRARSDATLQTLDPELLALAALLGRGSGLFSLGSLELQLLLEMQNQTPNTSLSPFPNQFFQRLIGDTALT